MSRGTDLAVTNPKLASLAPTWARYRGVSLLFDNPGTRPPPGVVPLEAIPVERPEQQRLYDDLAAEVADDDVLRARHGLCPLPRHSYHVTVCDGPNERDGRRPIAALLAGLPDSLHDLAADPDLFPAADTVAEIAVNPVTLVVSGVAVWGHVLAAQLAPAGAADRAALARVATARDALVAALWARLRLRVQQWRPHVSLGYFPNRDAAAAAAAALPARYASLPGRLTAPITFSSAALHGFTDMASFHRLGT